LIDAFSPSEFISLAEDRLAWIGRKVIVHEGGDYSYQARIKGLSPEGRLVLERNGKECVLSSGSILPA
jgi:BirA family biotin operon repressor/biotin-[acetyl-CoA-carboxylase] ligase